MTLAMGSFEPMTLPSSLTRTARPMSRAQTESQIWIADAPLKRSPMLESTFSAK